MTTNNHEQLNQKNPPKNKNEKRTKQTTITATDSQKYRSHGRLSAGKGMGENGGKGRWNKKHKW